MSDTLVCWIGRNPICGVYHRTCYPGVYGGMWKDNLWAPTSGYPPFLVEDQAALLMKNYHWQDGLRQAVMVCRACEVVLFDRDRMAEFRAEHAEHQEQV